MYIKTSIALATLLAICAASNAMARSIALNDDAHAASQDVVGRAPLLTEVAWRASPQPTHSRPRHSRNAGLKSGDEDNYQYWHQACCL
jgi:hypothetical protein